MASLRAHKIRLSPNAAQRSYFVRAAGVARYAHNWCLNIARVYYMFSGKTLSDFDLRKLWNAHRKLMLPWTYEVTKQAGDSGTDQFCAARKNWFASMKSRRAGQAGHFRAPRLKTKRRSKKSFTMYAPTFRVEDRYLVVPKLGQVRMTTSVRFPGKIKRVTISEQGGHWFASFLVEVSESYVYPHRCETQAVVGIDLGLRSHLTLSSEDWNEKRANPNLYRQYERKLRRAQRALSRKQKGSRNREKARQRLHDVYARLTNLRTNHLHQMTAEVVRKFRWIGIEDLAVSNMMRSHSVARAIAEARFGEARRQLEYKAAWSGSHVIVADRFYPSSKLCSACKTLHADLQRGDREWTCAYCGARHDRDINAARNLESVARGQLGDQNACVTASLITEERRSRSQSCEPRGSRAAAQTQECFTSSDSSDVL